MFRLKRLFEIIKCNTKNLNIECILSEFVKELLIVIIENIHQGLYALK